MSAKARCKRAASAALFRLAVLMGLLPAPVEATDSGLASMLERCAAIGNDPQRLACYDRLAATLAPTGTVQPPARSDAPTTRDREGFGLRKPTPPPIEDDAEAAAITSSIDQISRRPRGEHVFVLSNGQVWTELEVGRSRYHEGMEVTIERTPLGAYMLSTPGGRATRVRRIE